MKLDPKLCNYQGRSQQPLLHLAVLSCRDAGRKSFPISARREVVDLILRVPLLDIELRDRWGHSAGMIALKLYDFLPSGEQGIAVAILEQLMERGLDVLGTDAQGTDLLQMAAAGHNILALKALLAQPDRLEWIVSAEEELETNRKHLKPSIGHRQDHGEV